MVKKEELKREISQLRKENHSLRKKIIQLEDELETTKRSIKKVTKKTQNNPPSNVQKCDKTKANFECKCRTHRAYRVYYMTHTPADSFEVWIKGDKPVVQESSSRDSSIGSIQSALLSPIKNDSESRREEKQNPPESQKSEKRRAVSWRRH